MYYPVNDWQYAHDRHNDKLREAEHLRLLRALQPQRPTVVNFLKSQLVAWADLARPQRNRAQRA